MVMPGAALTLQGSRRRCPLAPQEEQCGKGVGGGIEIAQPISFFFLRGGADKRMRAALTAPIWQSRLRLWLRKKPQEERN